jgi:hypothetical protein
MKIYLAIWEDRHSDSEAYAFSTLGKAIEWAKATVREYDNELDETLTPPMLRGGWLYYGCYSTEGDHIRIVEAEIDGEERG